MRSITHDLYQIVHVSDTKLRKRLHLYTKPEAGINTVVIGRAVSPDPLYIIESLSLVKSRNCQE
jgi:hypothetical protein